MRRLLLGGWECEIFCFGPISDWRLSDRELQLADVVDDRGIG